MNDTKRTTTKDKENQGHLAWQSHFYTRHYCLYLINGYMFTHTLTDNAAEPLFVIFLSFFLQRLQSEWNGCPRPPILSCIPELSRDGCLVLTTQFHLEYMMYNL